MYILHMYIDLYTLYICIAFAHMYIHYISHIHVYTQAGRARRQAQADSPENHTSYEDKLKATSLDLFNEDRSLAADPSQGFRVKRVDHFKGYTDEHLQHIYEENTQAALQRR